MELYCDNFHLHTFGIISQEVPYQPNGGPIGSAEYIDFRAYDMWDRAEPPSSPQYYRRMPTSAISIVEESDGPKEESEPVFQHSDLNSVSAIRDGPPDDPMPHVQCGKLDIVSDFQEGPSEVPMPVVQNGEDVCFVYSTPPELNTGDWNGTQSLPSPIPLPLPDTGPVNEPTGEQTRAPITSGRRRVRYEDWQIEILTREFERNHRPSSSVYARIADATNVSTRNVRIWFKNRRANGNVAT
ncbi:hypothetical protein ECG_08471 [Echinococcus granulosus]|uniref:Pituitary homeobox n=1 Tax=Echinococcus granulosus TaxID=6210 RepID=A0A068WTF4_ECHGR|nr:hypothetical protein ECG_08471 [Echinococcus granulosus]CDS20969.1 pituitary homeobox [Echinococcus granulosus]